MRPYSLSTGWVSFTVAGTENMPVTMDADAEFHARYMTVSVRQSDVIVNNWGGDILLNNTSAGILYSNIAVPGHALGGYDRRFTFDDPLVISPKGTLVVGITHNTATATQVCVALHGSKYIA